MGIRFSWCVLSGNIKIIKEIKINVYYRYSLTFNVLYNLHWTNIINYHSKVFFLVYCLGPHPQTWYLEGPGNLLLFSMSLNNYIIFIYLVFCLNQFRISFCSSVTLEMLCPHDSLSCLFTTRTDIFLLLVTTIMSSSAMWAPLVLLLPWALFIGSW